SATQILQAKAFAAVSGTTAAQWLPQRIKELQVVTKAMQVDTYDAGVSALLARRADALFGERALLLNIAKRHASQGDLLVLDRLFTYEPLALVLPRDDE